MPPYSVKPTSMVNKDHVTIASFLEDDTNIDWKTVQSFGEEWSKFPYFSENEIEQIGSDYFDVVTKTMVNHDSVALDVGCGSGRWIKYVARRVKYVEGIDPSTAVFSASKFLSGLTNVRVTQASVERIPFADDSFDFVYSLGVLHHVPQTFSAIQRCHEKIKPGGWFLLYLYYNLDNRSIVYKMIFRVSNLMRYLISHFSGPIKRLVCDGITVLVYLPLATLSFILSKFSEGLADKLPLAYYRKTSFRIMRNDALDRFGTPLEKRFSRFEIERMLTESGFTSIQFSPKSPYWHVVAQKK